MIVRNYFHNILKFCYCTSFNTYQPTIPPKSKKKKSTKTKTKTKYPPKNNDKKLHKKLQSGVS